MLDVIDNFFGKLTMKAGGKNLMDLQQVSQKSKVLMAGRGDADQIAHSNTTFI